jgi:hypothetical protein
MNVGRYLAAVIAVWLVRMLFGFLFWGNYMAEQHAAATAAWSDAFREVIPAYLVADFLFALVFVWLWVKVGAAFGSDAKGGALYGLVIGLFSVVTGIYYFFSVTYISTTMWATEIVVSLVLHVLIGVVAALIYKATATRTVAAA